ncbi:MAG: adenosylcobinamide-GDP ribazoletransferase [Gloeomargaritaceae cyanobacterium C42_A2020_066]|nr:adenosylcobinamide-GDP ribazoletransferase [Gloeomargaritaceae cyanobacterium C42_A2020_066]
MRGIPWLWDCLGAVQFYTCLPLPARWPVRFTRVAAWAPVVGLGVGGLLGGLDEALALAEMPLAPRSALVMAAWVVITGGLHLDGAMDTADGLAVQDPERRLAVMADSRSGAFGVMAALILLLLKTLALADIPAGRLWVLMGCAGWGRWGQQIAILAYPYLKPTGKGAFHKAGLATCPWVWLPNGVLLWGLSLGLTLAGHPRPAVILALAGPLLALGVGYGLRRVLGGHTGDTYGAVVEWTEAGLLVCLTSGLLW